MSVALGLKIDSGYQRAAYLRTVETLLIESRQEHATEKSVFPTCKHNQLLVFIYCLISVESTLFDTCFIYTKLYSIACEFWVYCNPFHGILHYVPFNRRGIA